MCPDQGVLSAYLDGELMDPWRASVGRHVEGCAACTARLAGLRGLSRVLASTEAPGLEQAMGRVRSALAAARRPASGGRWRLLSVPVPLALAAATLLVVLCGALIYSLARPAPLPFSASRVVEADSDLRTLLDRLNADTGQRTVVFEIPADYRFAAFGEPEARAGRPEAAGMRRLRAMALAMTTSVALLGPVTVAPAQEIPIDEYVDQLQGLLKDVLQINIWAKVLSSKEQLVWEARKEAFTVPGLEVEVRVPSQSLVILAYITPERLKDDRILLRVHAEIRNADAARGGPSPRYIKVNYIPTVLGDKIRFYPLGEFPDLTADGAAGEGLYNLELEIQIVPYTAPKG